MPVVPRFEQWPTLPAMFFDQAARMGDRPMLRVKRDGQWEQLSWRSVADQVVRAARGLAALGVRRGDRVCLVAENRPEWLIADLAIMSLGAVTVPAYTTISVADYVHVLKNSGSTVAIVSGQQLMRRVYAAAAEVPGFRTLVALGWSEVQHEPQVDLVPWEEMLAAADAARPRPLARPLARPDEEGEAAMADPRPTVPPAAAREAVAAAEAQADPEEMAQADPDELAQADPEERMRADPDEPAQAASAGTDPEAVPQADAAAQAATAPAAQAATVAAAQAAPVTAAQAAPVAAAQAATVTVVRTAPEDAADADAEPPTGEHWPEDPGARAETDGPADTDADPLTMPLAAPLSEAGRMAVARAEAAAGSEADAAGPEASAGPAPVDPVALAMDGGPDDLACIIYTSGTGGAPKGVMLSHRAVLANCIGAYHVLAEIGLEEEVFLSCLPLSHAYEHSCGQFFPISLGAEIAYVEGVEKIGTNLNEVKPSIVLVVPRLMEVVQQRITREVERQGGVKERLFNLALALGKERYRNGGTLPVWKQPVDDLMETMVRAKVREKLGGRIKALVSGGAALNPDVGLFFHALGFPLLQGYGQTEAAPLISVNRFGMTAHHTVGPPVKGCEVTIAEDGEILARGPNVMLGYWQDPSSTERALADGWLHTGDVGHLDSRGRIVITDRKKDILVTSGGDNISPARVEGCLMLEPEIAQAVVCGDKRPYIVALLVPDAEIAAEWARRRGLPPDLSTLCADAGFRRLISAAVDRANSQLSSIERVRKFRLLPTPFTIENGLMTPTMKVKRTLVVQQCRETIEQLYD
ncbi:AMP-dependent synthetase/ligase [Rhodospirillum centenum]|nr:long-chain fatty acid--CoA ligase [Rhodospirillum centenum]